MLWLDVSPARYHIDWAFCLLVKRMYRHDSVLFWNGVSFAPFYKMLQHALQRLKTVPKQLNAGVLSTRWSSLRSTRFGITSSVICRPFFFTRILQLRLNTKGGVADMWKRLHRARDSCTCEIFLIFSLFPLTKHRETQSISLFSWFCLITQDQFIFG